MVDPALYNPSFYLTTNLGLTPLQIYNHRFVVGNLECYITSVVEFQVYKNIRISLQKVDRLKVRSFFLASQIRQTQFVVSHSPGCIGECMLSAKTCHSNFQVCQTNGLKVFQPLQNT